MTMPANKVRALVAEALAASMGELLTKKGFIEKKKGMEYTRLHTEIVQTIRVHLETKPSHMPGALGYVAPQVRIFAPRVNRKACEMVGNAKLLPGHESVTFSSEYEWFKPDQGAASWYMYVLDDIRRVSAEVAEFTLMHILDFLDRTTNVNSVIALYEACDHRLLVQEHSHIYMAAAYILEGRAEDARLLLERKLGKPGLRRRYASAFGCLDGGEGLKGANGAEQWE